MATREATWRYRERYGDAYGRTYFRRFGPGVVSSVGMGTYLGDPTAAVDDRYRAALVEGVESGANLVDTAANYRCGRSERVVGAALRAADVDREAVVLATKGGFVPFDGSRPDDPAAYVRRQFVENGPLDPTDLARGSHAMTPAFLDAMLDRSLAALGVETVDLYYVHNPETQLAERPRAAVYDLLEDAFARLEERRTAGDVGAYGVATWDAFRVPPDDDRHLSLPTVVGRARQAAERAGRDPTDHGLAAIQLPFSATMADAFTARVHPVEGDEEPLSALAYADRVGLNAFVSAPLGQGALARDLPAAVAETVAGDTPAQKALNFARSAPAVTAALVGCGRPEHVRENLAAGTFDPLGARAFDETFA
ncbi:MAG: aldo/keto reductase [Haloferacaceae archaeon]|jgi:aryl-alcohol dehydrogenase-like predicted oxidoreductase